jgi:hypothetical protein
MVAPFKGSMFKVEHTWCSPDVQTTLRSHITNNPSAWQVPASSWPFTCCCVHKRPCY